MYKKAMERIAAAGTGHTLTAATLSDARPSIFRRGQLCTFTAPPAPPRRTAPAAAGGRSSAAAPEAQRTGDADRKAPAPRFQSEIEKKNRATHKLLPVHNYSEK